MKRIILHSKQKLKNILFVVFFLVLPAFFNVSKIVAQSWQWAKGYGGVSSDKGQKICTDAQGNVFVAGTFSSSIINFGNFSLNNAGSGDVYVAKFHPNGTPLWVNRIGGAGNENIGNICADANGRVYVTGDYTSSSITVSPLTIGKPGGIGDPDIFLACFDPLGTPVWFKEFGSTGSDYGIDCAYSNTESALYLIGWHNSPSIIFSPLTLNNSSSSSDSYVAKFDLSLSPLVTPVYVHPIVGGAGYEFPQNIVLDETSSTYYISGNFVGTLTFQTPLPWGPTQISSPGLSTNVFIAKFLNTTSGVTWARAISSFSADIKCGDMIIDGAKELYISGTYSNGALSFFPVFVPITLPYSGQSDAFIAKMDAGGYDLWEAKIGNSAMNEFAPGLASDGNNNVYVCGAYAGTTVIGSTTVVSTASPSLTDVFTAKYNSTGLFQWLSTAQGAGSEEASAVTSDALGNVYVIGNYNISAPISFATTTLSSLGSNDAFLAKIGCLTATISGLSNVCEGTSATLTASGATNYTWSTGATTPSIIITPTANTSYSVLGAIGSCTGTSTNFSVTFLPASVNAGPNLNLLCNETQLINATTNPPNPTSVTWTPTTGLNNSNILTPSVIATASSIQYTLFANLSNGCTANDVVAISQYALMPNICMVTVDSIGVNNLILWDKTAYPDADTFYVYRDIANNNYQLIGKVLSTTAFGEFQDTVRSLYSANGDPKASSWRYKISYIDSCGNVSAKSPFHKTLFVQNNNGNFTWNDYQIEGQPIPVPALNNYIFRRDNNATGNWQNIQTLSSISTAYTDPNYNTFASTADWRAETQWAVQCNSNYYKNNLAATVKRSKSNLSNNKLIGLKEKNLEKYFSVYPNPTNDVINLNVTFNESYDVYIESALGQQIYVSKSNIGSKVIAVNKFEKGFYNLRIKTANGSINKKIIKE